MPDSFDQLIPDWAKEFPYAITVSDKEAIIIYMNDKSAQTFVNSGGLDLIGKSLYDCHSPASAGIIRELLTTGRSNIYTIEKNGVKKLICQAPWYTQGELSGLVEISILLPDPMQHFIRH